jgi:hypothetical protein
MQWYGLSWSDILINIAALAVLPGLLAVYGGRLAAESVSDPKRVRKIKLCFWGLFLALLLVTFWQQLRAAESEQEKTTRETWSEGLVLRMLFRSPIPPADLLRPSRVTPVRPDLGMEFVLLDSLAFRMVNQSDAIVRDAKYTFILVDLDGPKTVTAKDGAAIPQLLQIPTVVNANDFLRPRDRYVPRELVPTFPGAESVVKKGDRVFGFVVVTCPNCIKVRRYWLYFTHGSDTGWYSEFEANEKTELPIGKLLQDTEQTLDQIVPTNKRIPFAKM